MPAFRIDGDLVLYGVKFTIASLVALAVAFWSSLPQPEWAVITVAVLAGPHADQVTAKSIARIAGTVVGAAFGLVLVVLFAQHRFLFLGALCLWLGACTWLSLWFRGSQAYVFALSGYTATIVGLPAALAPSSAFDIAVGRVSEVGIGIAVTWVASALVFPRYSHVNLPDQVRKAGTQLAGCLAPGAAGAAMRVAVAGQFTVLHGFCGVALERGAEGARRLAAVRCLSMALMRALFLSRALSHPDYRRDDLDALAAALPAALKSPAEAGRLAASWEAAEARLSAEIAAAPRHGPQADAAVLWLRFAGQCRRLLIGAQALSDPSVVAPPAEGRFHLADADSLLAFIAAFQAIVTVGILAAFWLATGWQAGVSAIIVASVYTLRLASKLHAVGAYRMMATVAVLSTVPAMAIAFQLVPAVTTFPMLALVMAPYLLAAFMVGGLGGPYGPMAILIVLVLMVALSPANAMTYDFSGVINGVVAVLLSFLVCGAVSQIVLPTSAWLLRLRLLRAAERTLREAAGGSVEDAATAEIRLTFMISEIAPEFAATGEPHRETEAAFAAGLAAIAIARLVASAPADAPWAGAVADMKAGLRTLRLWGWQRRLAEIEAAAARGGALAEAAIASGGSVGASRAAASFAILRHALQALGPLSVRPARAAAAMALLPVEK